MLDPHMVMRNQVLVGDCLTVLRSLPDGSVHCCVTSPPYWGLRDYGHEGQIGQEENPQTYVDTLVQVFREVRRTLRPDGTLWLNLGDCHAARAFTPWGVKPKDLLLLPHRVALALQADGWWLRSEVVWNKPNALPECQGQTDTLP